MGYYTDYKIDIRRADGMGLDYGVYDEVAKFLSETTYYTWSQDLEAWGIKWYDHDIEMSALSTHFPELVFAVHGVGEEFPDIWVKYFHNGKKTVHRANITYPEFRLEDLK